MPHVQPYLDESPMGDEFFARMTVLDFPPELRAACDAQPEGRAGFIRLAVERLLEGRRLVAEHEAKEAADDARHPFDPAWRPQPGDRVERQAEERRSREWPDGFPYECLDHWTDHIPDNGDRQWIMWTNRPDSQFQHDSHFISTITRLEKSGRYRWQVDGSLGQGVTWTIDEGFAATLSAAKAKAEKVEAKAAAEAQEEAGIKVPPHPF